MCFAIPRQVKKVKGKKAWVEGDRIVCLGDLKAIHPGDYLLVYGNAAVSRLGQEEARQTRKLIKELA